MSDARSRVHNVGGWLARWAHRRGQQLAVADPDRRLDYAALEERSARLAGWLRAAGIGPGDRVAILLANRSAYLELVFGAARIGAISLPVNIRLSPREIRVLLDDCSPAALFYESELETVVEKACSAAGGAPKLRVAVGDQPDAYEEGLARSQPWSEVLAVTPDDPMMLMYTSGTTGVPKGALLPHRKTLFNSLNAQLYFDIRSSDRVLVVSPLFHSLGLLILSVPILYAGAALIFQRRFEAEEVWRCVERERITYLGGVPTMYQRLLRWLDAGPDVDLGSLRFLFTAGSAVSADLVHAYHRRGMVLKQGYGQTETSILTCLENRDAVRKAGSVGRPVFHADVRVVDRENLDEPPERWRAVEPGETGEIAVHGPILMLGYWQRPGASAEVMRGDWLRTGDLATVDEEGFITLAGRAREMLISGGENVYPAEVEAVYCEHPAIEEIAVVGVPDPDWGEVGRAHVVLTPGQHLDLEALDLWARDRLASFKLPRHFVVTDTLPKTATGKVQKHLLHE
jgi:fatty-acyl-CoA synthase